MKLRPGPHIQAAILSLGLLLGSLAQGVTLDAETHDVLISKLSEVRANLRAKDSSYVPTSLRLADLMSDRARLKDMDQMAKSGELSKEARNDRKQAIVLIEESLKHMGKAQMNEHVRANLLRAQLYQLTDQPKQAEKILTEIRKTQKGSDEYWTATDLLADLNFAMGNYAVSEKMYKEIQNSKKKNSFAQYRLAWCALHQGRETEAVKKIENLMKDSTIDAGLRTEASRDMAIFYARAPFKSSSIQKVIDASGSDIEAQRSNTKLFAEELKRLGKKKESALVFLTYLQMKGANEVETQSTQAELFENLVHIQRTGEANQVLEKIVKGNCEDKCADVQLRIHKTLRNWAALEKAKPSKDLVRSFVLYSQMKPLDQDALLFGIKVVQDAGQHQASLELLAVLINNTKDAKVLENALQAQIQSAEKTKVLANQIAAYDLYLLRGQDAKLKTEIALVRITTLIAMGNMKDAETSAENLYRQSQNKEAGDMLLGIFQKTKQTEKERLLSLDLAKGSKTNAYFVNYKRLSLDLAKKRLDANLADRSDYDLLVELSAVSKSKQEKYKILSDAFLVALKIEDFDRLKKTSVLLIEASKGLGAKEKSLAVEKRMFVADLELDFKTSAALEKQNQKGYTSSGAFRLVLKSRLAGRPELALEKRILRDSSANLAQRVWILENQMMTTNNGFRLLRENNDMLKTRRELNARFALMALAKGSERDARQYLKSNKNLNRSLFALMLQRRDALVDMTKQYRAALKTRIQMGSMNSFNRTLDQRLAAMNKFERNFAGRRNKDSVLSMIAQGYMSGLHLTLANDLDAAATRVPAPASLKKDFQVQLNSKASELRKSVAQSESDMEKGWETSGFENEMGQVFLKAHPLQRQALLKEIALWKTQSYGVIQKSWSRLERAHQRESVSSLAGLYSKVQKNPFHSDLTKELARAEEDRGNHLISAFLIERDRQRGGI